MMALIMKKPDVEAQVLGLFDHGIYDAIARFFIDIGMVQPATQDSFPFHPNLFQHAGRGVVVDIANCPNPVDTGLGDGPVEDELSSLRGIPLVPIVASQDIAQVGTMFVDAQFDHPDDFLVLLHADHPGKGCSGFPDIDASFEKGFGHFYGFMRVPVQITRDQFVFGVVFKNRCSILEGGLSQHQSGSIKFFGWLQ